MYWYCKEKVRVNNLVPRAREESKKPWEWSWRQMFPICAFLFHLWPLLTLFVVWSRDYNLLVRYIPTLVMFNKLKDYDLTHILKTKVKLQNKTSNGIKLWKTLTCICTLSPPYCVFVLFLQQLFKLQKQVFHAVWWHVLQVRLRFEFKFYSACLYMWFFSFFFVAGTLVQLI